MLGTWIDYSSGRVSGAAMAAAGVTGAFRYVGIGGSGKRLTRAEYVDHLAAGRQTIAVVERVTTDADGGAPAGTANARAALADLAVITAGLEPIQYVLMANDQNRDTAAEVAYLRAAVTVLGPAGFVVGPYGFGDFVLTCHAAGLTPISWQAGPAPSRTGTAGVSTFWQRNGGPAKPADGPATPVTRVIGGVTCDLTNQLLEVPVADLTPQNLADIGHAAAAYSNPNDPTDVDMHQHAKDATTGLAVSRQILAAVTAMAGTLSTNQAALLAAFADAQQHVDVELTDAQISALSGPIVTELAALPGAVRLAIGQALVAPTT